MGRRENNWSLLFIKDNCFFLVKPMETLGLPLRKWWWLCHAKIVCFWNPFSISSRILGAQTFLFFNLQRILQIFVNFLSMWEKRRIFWACFWVGKKITFSLPIAENSSIFNITFQIFKCFFQQVLTSVIFICYESLFSEREWNLAFAQRSPM